jgi:crossover junction endodeoxyribonuclease RuvC
MRILGIDPGLATIGYGIIDVENSKSKVISYGVISTPKDKTMPERLAIIEADLTTIIDKFSPDEVAIEELFFNTNITTGINVAHARGVIVLTCLKKCGKLFEYTPLQIKQALTGYGRAEKRQIQEMTRTFLSLKSIPRPDDAADALAVALTHSHTNKLKGSFEIK